LFGAALLLLASTAMAEPQVNVCHVPPGNPGNAHTINVPVSAVPAHLAHGDALGDCVCRERCRRLALECAAECDGDADCIARCRRLFNQCVRENCL
jgi:hypothetical protein